MENEIYQKLNKIEELNDRVLLKKILNGVFKNLEDYTDKKLEAIETRVFNEIDFSEKKYEIYSTIEKRDRFDETDDFMYPIIDEDFEQKTYKAGEIIKAMNNHSKLKLFKVFMECDYLTIQKLLKQNSNVSGIIKTDKKDHEAYFRIKKSKDYENVIKELYKNFIANGVIWRTVNDPFINKMLDVFMVGVKDKLDSEEKIEEIAVDFGDYSKYVRYDMVPLWNVEKLSLKSSGFPVPCEDKINYEHKISIVKSGKENGYLVDIDNQEFNYTMLKENSIIVSTSIDKPSLWKVIQIKSCTDNNNYNYEIMSNELKNNFSNRLYLQEKKPIKTKTELARFFNSYSVAEYIRFLDVDIEDNRQSLSRETYEINDFIIDELRDSNAKKSMILYFQPKDREYYLNYDILSFLVSEIQIYYPEYRCEGRLK